MKVVLAYNSLDSVSGETTFFNNITEKLKEKGLAIECCGIDQMPSRTLGGRFETYSRFPLLLNTHRRLKKFEKSDILHFLNASLSPGGRFLKNKKKIATAHNMLSSYLSLSPSSSMVSRAAESVYCNYVDLLDGDSFRSLDYLVACSDYQHDRLKESYGLSGSKLKTIYPGVDLDYFRKIPKVDLRAEFDCDYAIAYTGRLHERSKGVSYLIRSMKLLPPKAKLLIVGDGPDRTRYERLAKTEGLEDRVKFLGKLSFDAKSSIQKSADLVALPSRYEVFGTVFAESLACGTPVVAFDMPFWKGLYDGMGLLVKPFDERALAKGIGKLLEEPKLRSKMASRGKELSTTFDLNKTASDYIRLYETLYAN